MDFEAPIYQPSTSDGQFRQGEIITNLKRFGLVVESLNDEVPTLQLFHHDYAIILSQDCDLEQDFSARNGQGNLTNLLPSILCCEVVTAETLRGSDTKIINSKRWSTIKVNKDDRFHFFEKIPPDADLKNEGLPELALDFKRLFCVQADELYSKSSKNDFERRSRLASPYLEHLSSRFSFYISRVALPHDHASDKQ